MKTKADLENVLEKRNFISTLYYYLVLIVVEQIMNINYSFI